MALHSTIPLFEAEESILAASRTAVGSGALKPADSKSIMSDWNRTIRAARPSEGRHYSPLELSGMGIQVVSA